MKKLLIIILLSGCSAPTGWVKTHEPVEVKKIVDVPAPCGIYGNNGCFTRVTGVMELKLGMSYGKRWCVEHHERKHAAGYDRDESRDTYGIDCGNGEIYSEAPEQSPYARMR